MKNQEKVIFIKPTDLYTEAQRRYKELTYIRNGRQKELEKAPPGKIHIVRDGSKTKFYLRTDPKDKSGRYLPADEQEKINTYVRKAYDEKLVKLLDREIKSLGRFLADGTESTDQIRHAYSDNTFRVQKIIEPVDMSDEDYVSTWLDHQYVKKEISETVACYETDHKERVRSKSELTIANALARHGIPYRYECPLILKNGIKIYPDFTALNVKNRKQMYWEHRGMMDNPEYARHTVERLKQYMRSGLIPGRDLIITEETSENPLGTDEIEMMIKEYLLF